MSAPGGPLSRRRFLARSAALGAGALWAPALPPAPAGARSTVPPPAGFPSSIPLCRQAFENWAGDIRVPGLWTCAPRTPEDVVAVTSWACAHGYTVRPRGVMHSWSPLTVTPGTRSDAQVILVDTRQHLTAMEIASSSPPAVRVQTGATMDDLLGFLEAAGYGLTATPAAGDVTVGGALAVGAHGAGVPGRDEGDSTAGRAYGSLSNLIVSLTAVVWDASTGRYVLRTFDRSHPDCKVFLTHLGRAFLTEVTLRVAANDNLRCVSFVDIPAAELFARPGSGASRTFASFVESAGRVEAIWYAFTDRPWLKVWSVQPSRPAGSRVVSGPYNYPFSDRLPGPAAKLIRRIVGGVPSYTPVFGHSIYDVTAAGLEATLSRDIWGPSKNLLLYVRPTTLRVTANGYAVLTARHNIQRVVSEFAVFYRRRLDAYRSRGRYPINLGVEVRVTGLDTAGGAGGRHAAAPVLSALRHRPDRPAWDVAVWFDILTFPGTPGANRFYRELEGWALRNYSGAYAALRPEWSKGWGYTDVSAWSEPAILTRAVPDAYREGRRADDDWDWAAATLDRYDPHRIFSNAFLDTLFPRSAQAASLATASGTPCRAEG